MTYAPGLMLHRAVLSGLAERLRRRRLEQRVKDLEAENARLKDELATARKQAEDEAAARAKAVDNLKLIGIALHKHADGWALPPDAKKDGWLWHLLPYVEQDDLFRKLTDPKSKDAPPKQPRP